MNIALPQNVRNIIETLEAAGFEAYAVGGCIRDSVLGRTPADWDITTSAKPREVKNLFRRTVDTGIEHGTVTVLMDRKGYEVTTYRVDGEYLDNRHPRDVSFTRDLTEDLRRRDFTVNAIAYNERQGLVDVFEGVKDLNRGLIRCVGDPRERFGEDALRILRAVRFAAQLGFEIEEETKKAAALLADTLEHISAERIQTELVKLLISPHPKLLKTAWELGFTRIFLPEFDAMMAAEKDSIDSPSSVGEHTLKALEFVDNQKSLRLAVLCQDFGVCEDSKVSRDMAEAVLRRLKFDNDTIRRVKRLVEHHNLQPEAHRRSVRRMMNQVGEDIFPDLLQLMGANVLAGSDQRTLEKLTTLDRVYELFQEITESGECVSLKTLAVTGKDLIAAGRKPGKEIGQILNRMLEDVIEYPEHNSKEYLMEHFIV